MSGLGYTLPAVVAAVAVCLCELVVLRTGLFRRPSYWTSLAIMVAFQIPVDGWLTRPLTPVVRYRAADTLGVRFPWHIPIEDFVFGFALITAVLLAWERQRRRDRAQGRAG